MAIVESVLSVIAPIKITDAKFISSTEPENDAEAPLWLASTTYAIAAKVRRNHVVYQAVKASTAGGQDPSLVIYNSGDNAFWTKIGPTNKWACVDDEVSTPTVSAGPSMTMVFAPGFFTSAALLGLDADVLDMLVNDPTTGEILFTYSGLLESSQPPDYWEYFYDPFIQQTEYITSDIPPYNTAQVSVTLSKTSGTVAVGMIAFGDVKALGVTQYGAKVSPKSYSYVDTNEFGETVIVRGKKATDMTVTARLKVSESPTVVQILQNLMDVPCVWIGTNLTNYNLRTFGLGNGSVTYDNFSDALLTVNIEGMI